MKLSELNKQSPIKLKLSDVVEEEKPKGNFVGGLLKGAKEGLPVAGATAGGLLGIPLGPVGMAAGAGVGGMAGKGLEQLIDIVSGEKKGGMEVAKEQLGAGAMGVAGEMGGQVAGKALGKGVDFITTQYAKKQAIKQALKNTERALAEQSAISRVTQALKEAKPIRAEQETIYTKVRGERIKQGIEAEKAIGGQAGYKAKMEALGGEMPKVKYENLKVTQKDADELFDIVAKTNKLPDWDKLPAQKGLAKMFGEFGGEVPTEGELAVLNKVFGKDLTSELLAKRTFFEKAKANGLELINVPRSIMSSFDMSFGLRQGIFTAYRHPVLFTKAFANQFKDFFSEKAFQSNMEKIMFDPRAKLAKESGLALTDLGGMGTREEKFMSPIAEKIPGIGKVIRASSRAYTGMANKLRFDVFNDLVKNAERLGRNPIEDPELTKQIASFVNAATGRGSLKNPILDLEKSATALNAIFFSPRLMASRLTLLSPKYYVTGDKFVRQEAIKSLMAFTAGTGSVLGMAKLAGAKVGDNPFSSDFGKIKIGDTRMDIAGGFQQYIRSAAQFLGKKYVSSVTGKEVELGKGYKTLTRKDILMRQIESKEAPLLSFITALMNQKDIQGKPISVPKEIANRFIPMILSDMVEIAKNDPELLPIVPLGAFGVGLQSYRKGKVKPKLSDILK